MKPIRSLVAIASLLTCSTVLAARQPELDFAERLLSTAASYAAAEETRPAAIAFRDAALRIGADEPRLLRSAIDLTLQLGDRDKAIELLNAYRKLDPNDQLAQVQTIDLLVDGMQTADGKKQYMSRVAGSDAVPKDVRAHVAVKLFALLTEMGDDAGAAESLNQALLLNPVNPKALQMQVERLFNQGATAPQRTTALVNLLKSNPMQPASLATLAQELARCGAADEATAMYRNAFEMNNALGITPEAEDVVNLSALLLAQGKTQEAASLAAAATQIAPSSASAWFMRIMVEKHAASDENFTAAFAEARSALTKNLMVLHRAIDNTAPEVTDKTAAVLPDVRADAKAVDARSDLGRLYAAALGDYAWLDAYFGGKSPDPAVLEAIVTLTGENSTLLTRLQGFAALGANQLDEAKVKLSAIADRDALARLGLASVKLKQGTPKDQLAADASKLLLEMPVGVWSSTVRHTLSDLSPISFATEDKPAVVAEAAKLSAKWLGIARSPDSFYLMELRPVKVGLSVGDPMLLKLRVQNISDFPLVIGPGGVIDQSVAIDAQVRGPVEQYFPGVAVARLSGELVLQPRQSTFATVRIDNGELGSFFQSVPQVSLSVYASSISNARIIQQEQGPAVVPGPGGFREQGQSVMDRVAVPLAREDTRQSLANALTADDASKRLSAYRAVIGNLQALANVTQPNDQHRALAEVGQKMLAEALARETDPTVRALVLQQQFAILGSAETIVSQIKAMVASPDWQSRLTAAAVSQSVPQAQRADLIKPLATDPDELVKTVATVVAKIPDPAPATQPAP